MENTKPKYKLSLNYAFVMLPLNMNCFSLH